MSFTMKYFFVFAVFSLIEASLASKYGNKSLDEWTFLTAHNSHVNWPDSKILDALTNQNHGIDTQLEYGVRGFMFDIDWKQCSSFEQFFGACKCKGICLCHGPCSDLVKDGFHIKNFEYALKKIVDFLNKNQEEIVTIFLEDYIDDVRILQKAFNEISGFNRMVFNPYSSRWNVSEQGWPRIVDMIRENKRILIVDDEQRGIHAQEYPGIIRSRDFLLQNHYEWESEVYQWDNFNVSSMLGNTSYLLPKVNSTVYLDMSACYSLHRNLMGPLWYANKALNMTSRENKRQVVNGKKLFLFNHFIGIKALTETANPFTKALMNKKDFVMRRLIEKCYTGTNFKKPNYIALDFIEKDVYVDLIEPFNKI